MEIFQNHEVKSVFDSYPSNVRQQLLHIRELIFDVARNTACIGEITETLKWGQPSYLTEQTNSGTTIRIDRFDSNKIAIFFHCQTTLVSDFREFFPNLEYSKNRAVIIEANNNLPFHEIRECIYRALTYKLSKRKSP